MANKDQNEKQGFNNANSAFESVRADVKKEINNSTKKQYENATPQKSQKVQNKVVNNKSHKQQPNKKANNSNQAVNPKTVKNQENKDFGKTTTPTENMHLYSKYPPQGSVGREVKGVVNLDEERKKQEEEAAAKAKRQASKKQVKRSTLIIAICGTVAACVLIGICALGVEQYRQIEKDRANLASELAQSVDAENDAKEQVKELQKEKEGTTASKDSSSDETETANASAEHVHDWTPVVETKHTDAVTHTVHHDAQYKTETKYVTLCNICKEEVTGKTAEHTAQTGHNSGFTTNVPKEVQTKTSDAWDETVVDTPAKDEEVISGYTCSCGATK